MSPALLAQVDAAGRLTMPKIDYASIFPELVLGGGALLLLLLSSLFRERGDARLHAFYTAIVGLVSLASTFWLWKDLGSAGVHSTFAGAIANDHFSLFFVVVISSAVVLSALISSDWLERTGRQGPELFVLVMLAGAGGMLMAAANDLIVAFLGLEILSLALYVLTGYNRSSEASREAAMKYFLLGGFSSAIFLYGIALIYGAIGTTNLSGIATFLMQNALIDSGLLLAGMVLLAVGFAFKVAAVPFHQWTPDVYQGAPTPVTGFMAAAAKAAAFAAMLRIFASTLYTLRLDWQPVILALAVLTLLVGSVVACVQQNVKRMLAYSSVSHAGYVLLGLQAANANGVGGSLYYLLAYTFMVIGSFAVVTVVGGQEHAKSGLEAFRGLGKTHPGIALAFTVLLLAQAGVPLTSGFLAKFYVLSALVENGSYATAVFAMVIAAIAAFFYLRIVLVMYSTPNETVDESSEPPAGGAVLATTGPTVVLPAATWLALGVAVALTVALGVLPSNLLDTIKFARQATADLFPR